MATVLALLAGCRGPTHDQTVLKAIKAESRTLMLTHPTKTYVTVPESQWPGVIASLKPERVTVYSWGVDISTKAYFDGGWGYEIPRNGRDLPMPEGCYSEPARGVFWHGPC